MVRASTSLPPHPANGVPAKPDGTGSDFDAAVMLNALPDAVLGIDNNGLICFLNIPAQEFFDISAAVVLGQPLSVLIPVDSPVFALAMQVVETGASMSETGIELETARLGRRALNVKASPLGEHGSALVVLHEFTLSRRIDGQLNSRQAARSVTAMAAMLAHEIKNPLSGIRGAAQLLEQNATEADRELTRLICDETDRIVKLVGRMEAFSDNRPIQREAVNIHAVLDHVRRLAQSGFARKVQFIERYDPSLPLALANRDQLVQVFLNLVKNAAEALPAKGGEIILSTAYQRGVRMAGPGSDGRVELPLMVTVQDNGSGIADDIRPHLFDAFVTGKVNGTGLGLALVAKIIGDHGGAIEVDSQPRKTMFRVSLPVLDAADFPAPAQARPGKPASKAAYIFDPERAES